MTCIVGIVDPVSGVWIGGDSAGVSGHQIVPRRDPKVFQVGEFLYGITGSFRMGQVLRYRFQPPYLDSGCDREELYKYMVQEYVDALRECFKEEGIATSENGLEVGGRFLVGVQGRLFQIDSDYQVAELSVPYAAIGSGDDIAMGSLFSTAGRPPQERLQRALEAAQQFCNQVRAPFVMGRIDSVKGATSSPDRVLRRTA